MKRKIIIKYLAWLSTKLKGHSFKLPYDFLAGSSDCAKTPVIISAKNLLIDDFLVSLEYGIYTRI